MRVPSGGRGRVPKELRPLVRACLDAGCEVRWGGRHLRVSRDGHLVATLPGSPGDRRSLANQWAQLRRAGIEP